MKTQYKPSSATLGEDKIDIILQNTRNWTERFIIESLYFPALRRFEVVNLRVEHLNPEEGTITVYGKGGKVAPVPVGILYPDYLRNLVHFCGKRKTGYVFQSPRQAKYDVSRINQMVRDVCKRAGIKHPNGTNQNVNPHLFRHTQARHLKNRGLPMEFIQNYLRHSSFKTTMDVYGTLSIEDMKRIAFNNSKLKLITDNGTGLIR